MDFDFADFLQVELIALEREAALWIGEGIIPGARTKAGKSGLLAFLDSAKEIVEGEADALQDILNDLGMNAGEVFSFGLDLW
jgi:hypothetical protein